MNRVVRTTTDEANAIVATDAGTFALVRPGEPVTFHDTALAARQAVTARWIRPRSTETTRTLTARALELAVAAGTTLDVLTAATDAPRRVYRVPAKVRAEAARGVRWAEYHGAEPALLEAGRRLSASESADVGFVAGLLEHRLRTAPDDTSFGYHPTDTAYPNTHRIVAALLGGRPGAAWANKIARTHQLTLLSSAFVYAEADEYRAILAVEDQSGGEVQSTATGLVHKYTDAVDDAAENPDLSTLAWERRVPGAWEAITPEDADALETVEIDQDTATALAAWVDEDNGDETFDLFAVNVTERNLFALAAPHLDTVELERAALVAAGERDGNYTPQERSQNVERQGRASDGKFGGGSGAPDSDQGTTVTAFAKARLPSEMPLVADVGGLIDTYLAENAPGGSSEPEEPPALDDPVTAAAPPPGPEGVTPLYLALVDEVDTSAVLDLIAIVPPEVEGGEPGVFKRDRGQWMAHPDSLTALRSVTPPAVVEVTDLDMVTSIVDQIDAYTAQAKPVDDKAPITPVAASAGYFAYGAYGEMFPVYLPSETALTAGGIPGIADTPGDRAAVRRLQRYWSHGIGAAKVRWGTPGDLTRCARHVSKYMTRDHAFGFCQLRHRDALGTWNESNRKKR